MPLRYNYDQYLHGLLQQMERRWNARSLNLGGSPLGGGGPPGGFVGYLPQTRIAYDNVELETDYTPGSGYSIVDNLNHIRYRVAQLEGASPPSPLSVYDDDSLIASGVTIINFEGSSIVTDNGGGEVTVTISGGVGSGIVNINATEIAFGSPTDELTSNPYFRLIEDEGYVNYPYLLIGTSTTDPDILTKYGSTITIVYDNSDVEGETTNFELYGYDTYQSIFFTREGGTEASPASIDPNDIVGEIDFYGRGTWEWEGHSIDPLDLNVGYFQVTALETPSMWMSSDMMTTVYSTNSKLAWKIPPSGAGYPSEAFFIIRDLAYFRDDVQMELDSAFYFGSRTADGSWRIVSSGADLLTQKRESGNWVTKHTIS